ncbi:MAG: MBL fold metallo-hydrolase [bacterium]
MIVKVLAENTLISDQLECEHGLSLYLETQKHKILFDTGASSIFMRNARKMNVNLKDIDILILSHGHYDHGGGLEWFLSLNSHAKIYLKENAFGDYYSIDAENNKEYIGLNKNLLPNARFVFAGDNLVIDDELELFSAVSGEKFMPLGNNELFKSTSQGLQADDFSHEQNLIIRQDNQLFLIYGCAHRGVVNIMEHFISQKGCFPDVAVGGFHLYSKNEDPKVIKGIASYIKETPTCYYTCHCTGEKSFVELKQDMPDKIFYLATGMELSI